MCYYVANRPLQKFANFANVFWHHPNKNGLIYYFKILHCVKPGIEVIEGVCIWHPQDVPDILGANLTPLELGELYYTCTM